MRELNFNTPPRAKCSAVRACTPRGSTGQCGDRARGRTAREWVFVGSGFSGVVMCVSWFPIMQGGGSSSPTDERRWAVWGMTSSRSDSSWGKQQVMMAVTMAGFQPPNRHGLTAREESAPQGQQRFGGRYNNSAPQGNDVAATE